MSYGGRQQGRFYEHEYDAPRGPYHRSSSSHRVRANRRRSRSRSSSSSSSSRKKELQELRAFKAQAEKDKQSAEQKAEAPAAEQARKKEVDELEQRMIKAISAVTPKVPLDAKIPQSPKPQLRKRSHPHLCHRSLAAFCKPEPMTWFHCPRTVLGSKSEASWRRSQKESSRLCCRNGASPLCHGQK